ncbi:IclR family transcriptional regulator [Pseudonocardia hispaniensis]|uniref:IclR family transcriptional regulator n=1 Tax=Pseudonocardia hispaniensis TaxID=904933 RepID=A0ABW1IYX2_9PSEU
MTAPTGTQAVDRAAALLALVVRAEGPRTFTSLVDELGLAKSTTSRLLQALERHRLLLRDRDGAFRPGPLFTLYAARHDPVHDLVDAARSTLQRIGEATAETVNLAVPRGDAVVQVAQVDSTFLLGATNWVGVDVPAHCTALGKVFYAHEALPLPAGPLEQRTPHSRTDPAALRRDLAEVVRRGFAVSREELELGLVAVAAPIRSGDGAVIAAVSVSGPTPRLGDRLERIGKLLVNETATLSAQLGHPPRKEGAA